MTDTLKQVIELCNQLSYEEIEVIKEVAFDINYKRKRTAMHEAEALIK